jgi:hypothetical protein
MSSSGGGTIILERVTSGFNRKIHITHADVEAIIASIRDGDLKDKLKDLLTD